MKKILSEINIHTFGDGKGESITVEFPNKKIGIIDFGSFTFFEWIKNYISQKEYKEIEFLLWTHPHYDHSCYLLDFLNYIKEQKIVVRNFFAFDFQHITDLADMIDFIDENILSVYKTSYHIEMFEKPQLLKPICKKIIELKKTSIIKNIEYLSMGKSLYDKEKFDNIGIKCLSPTPRSSEKYKEFIKSFEEDNSKLAIENRNHNLISVAILINFNNNLLLLGGDTENDAWNEIMTQERFAFFKENENMKFLKAPHHGSKTAFDRKIWEQWGSDYQVVVTPLTTHHLPRENILLDIAKVTKNLVVLKEKNFNKPKIKIHSPLDIFQDAKTNITNSKEETHHFLFNIKSNGNIQTKWITE